MNVTEVQQPIGWTDNDDQLIVNSVLGLVVSVTTFHNIQNVNDPQLANYDNGRYNRRKLYRGVIELYVAIAPISAFFGIPCDRNIKGTAQTMLPIEAIKEHHIQPIEETVVAITRLTQSRKILGSDQYRHYVRNYVATLVAAMTSMVIDIGMDLHDEIEWYKTTQQR